MAPASCMPAHCFCESIRPYLVRQPLNTISSLAFLVPASLILARGLRSAAIASPLIRSHRVFPLLYGIALALIGVGSAFYHASLSFIGQTIDVVGMYLIATFILLYNASRLRRLSAASTATLYIAGNAGLLWLLVTQPEVRRYLFAVLIIVGLFLEYRIRRRVQFRIATQYLLWAIALLVIGFCIWVLDITRTICSPLSAIQGHSIWHVLTASSATLLFFYYSSERPAVESPVQAPLAPQRS
jgi:hypothetical protein